jgi:molecular chaperone GrpE (heat shock protein)
MVENIEKIQHKISRFLNQIADLKKNIVTKDREHDEFQQRLALQIIEYLDHLDDKAKGQLVQATTDRERKIIHDFRESTQGPLREVLSSLGVTKLSAPLDILADFCVVVDTVKNEKRKDDSVLEVVRPGYSRNEDLLRPSQVIAVKN